MWLKVLSNHIVGSPGSKPPSSGGVQKSSLWKRHLYHSHHLNSKGLWSIMPGTGTKIRYLFLINQNIAPDKDSYPQANGSQHLLCDYLIPTCWMFVEGRHPSGLCRISVMWPRSRPWTPSIRKLMSLPLSFMLLLCKLASLPADMACSQWLSFTPKRGYPSALWGLCRFPQDPGSSKS